MNISKEWIVTEFNDEFIVVPIGENSRKFKGVIKLNKSGKEIWDYLKEGKNVEEIARLMSSEYDNLSYEKALSEVDKVINKLQLEGLMEK